jgi:hypothetical protein
MLPPPVACAPARRDRRASSPVAAGCFALTNLSRRVGTGSALRRARFSGSFGGGPLPAIRSSRVGIGRRPVSGRPAPVRSRDELGVSAEEIEERVAEGVGDALLFGRR